MLQVVKVGGAALNDSGWLDRFADAAAVATDATRIIVHGGGPEITQLSAQIGLAAEFSDGRRVTSAAALDLTSMVLNGRINKRIVRTLRSRGVDAFGLSGEDGAVITGRVMNNGALGRVGEVVSVRAELLRSLIELGLIPVISPVSIGTDYGALNINADEAATAVAQSIDADEMLFLTDVPAVQQNGSNIKALSAADARSLIANEVATGGMALKLNAAIASVKAGVSKARIGPLEMLWDVNAGTTIHAEEIGVRSVD